MNLTLTSPRRMALLLTLSLSVLSLLATAQRSRMSTSIDDDDRTMAISVEGTVNGREINYNRRFNVAGMSGTEKEALKSRVLDSLGVSAPPQPLVVSSAPTPPTAPTPPAARSSWSQSHSQTQSADDGEEDVTFLCKTCTGKMRLEITGTNFSLSRETSTNKENEDPFPMTVQMAPGKYEYIYWQNGVQQMQLSFEVKAGQKNEVTVK